MLAFQHIYSNERIQNFIEKYEDSINIDKTKTIKCGIINKDEIDIAVELLKQGELVAFPTETVYGLGANALMPDAINRIFQTKRRPLSDPLIVHVGSTYNLYTDKPDYVDVFAQLFWPGPFTIVLKSTQLETTDLLSAGTGYIGIRIPNNPIALQILQQSNLPIAAPSANLFTHISPTSPVHVFNDFYDQRVHIIDADRCSSGIESTVIKPVGDELRILRLGSLARATIEQTIQQHQQLKHFKTVYIPKIINMKEEEQEQQQIDLQDQQSPVLSRKSSSMEAPGQLLKHYSPNIQTYLLTTTQIHNNQSKLLNIDITKCVVIDFGSELKNTIQGDYIYKSLSSTYDAKEAMFNLYDVLRWAEMQPNAELILLYDFDNSVQLNIHNNQNVLTVQDKMFRSASGQKVYYDDNHCFHLLC